MPKKSFTPVPQLCKTIFEMRYAPRLSFFNLFGGVAQDMEGYPDWEATNLGVTLFNMQKRCSLTIQHNRFVFDQDSDKIDDQKNYIVDIFESKKLPEALEITLFQRVGLRRRYLVPVETTFDELVSIMDMKLLSQDEQLKAIIPPKTNDLAYRVDASDGPLKYHILLGPVRKEEVPVYVGFTQNYHLNAASRQEDYSKIVNSYPQVSVFIDIDIFKTDERIAVEEAFPFWENSSTKVEEMVFAFRNYLFNLGDGS